MNVKQVTKSFAVSPQIRPAEVPAVGDRFSMLINNRPDGEEPGQPTSEELSQAAAEAGLDYRHVPVVPGNISDQDVREFAQAILDARGPVLAFCRTGTRSASLWALSQARTRGADAVFDEAARAGYDLGALAERIRAAAAE